MNTVKEFEEKALTILTDDSRSYYQHLFQGTFQENFHAINRYKIKPRVMRDVSVRDLTMTILGHPIAFPVCIGPTAFHLLAHPDGEFATAEGARRAGVAYTMALSSSTSPADVVERVPHGLRFFQMYLLKDRSLTLAIVRRVEQLGFTALVLTADTTVIRKAAPEGKYRLKVFSDIPGEVTTVEGKRLAYQNAPISLLMKMFLVPDDIRWLKEHTDLPIIVKGILSGADVDMAIDAGASGILVSNHGARLLDGVIGTLDALPEVVQAARGRCEVYLDSGIRTGSDVYKALALGARAVFIGRPALYGLACQGAAGVESVLTILKKELDTTMALTGCRSIADISPDHLYRSSSM